MDDSPTCCYRCRSPSEWNPATVDEGGQFFQLDGPIDAVPGPGQMRAANFRGFARVARRYGANPAFLLNSRGLNPALLADPDNHISCQAMVDLLEYCSEHFDDPLFGLHLAADQSADIFGAITALGRAAPDMRSALHAIVAYLPVVHAPDCLLEVEVGEEMTELSWQVTADLGVNEQANYQGLMLQMKLLRVIGGDKFRASYVHIAGEVDAKDRIEIERIVDAPVTDGTGRYVIGFPTYFLEYCIDSSNKLLFSLLGGYLVRLKDAAGRDIAGRVGGYIRGALPQGNCTIERCAAQIGLSVRTLQIRLDEAGTSFSSLLDYEREKIAKIHLRHTAMTLDEIAARLGYGEQTSFGRAFKRWTGTSPQRYRKQQAA